MTTPDALREAYARIIDPIAWRVREQQLEYAGAKPADPLADPQRYDAWHYRTGLADQAVAPSLAKADAIIALTTTPLAVDRGLPENPSRECTVCTAVVAEWPTVMCCHCYEMPWKLRDAAPTRNIGDAEAREALEAIQLHATNHGGWVENDPWKGVCHIHDIATAALAKLSGAGDGRHWEPHLDYAGEPMEPGQFRDPPLVGDGWQDIATCEAWRFDHMNPMLANWTGRGVRETYWDEDAEFDSRPDWWPSPRCGWRSPGDQCIPVNQSDVTHWRPLPLTPNPPKATCTPLGERK